MTGLDKMQFEITDEKRPCWYKGQKAMFHRWAQRSEIVAPSPMVGGHGGGTLYWIAGIIEFENGTICEAMPEHIRFADGGEFNEYDFDNPPEGQGTEARE